MKLKIYQLAIIVTAVLIFGLTVYFIVDTAILMSKQEALQDYILMLVCFILILAMMTMHVINTIISKKQGSTFIKPLAFDNDDTVNKVFIVFCSIFGVLSIGVIVYFSLILSGFELYFSNFIRPVSYLITDVFCITLTDCIFIILFPLVGRSDLSFSKKKRKK